MIGDGEIDGILTEETGLPFCDGKATGRRYCYEVELLDDGDLGLFVDQTLHPQCTVDDICEAINKREKR